jgi:uncharacterized protein (TIGR02231 family)
VSAVKPAIVEVAASLPVAEVTVLEDRARVIRRGEIDVPAGQSRLIIDGVAPVLVDKSLGAALSGVHVLDVRCERRLVDWDESAHAERAREVAALEQAQRDVQEALARAETAHAAAQRDAEAIATLRREALRELASDAAWGRAPAPGAELERLDARERDAVARAAQLGADSARQQRDADALRVRLQVLQAAAGREAAQLVIDVRADEAIRAEATVEYVVPGACWRPYHTATLDVAGKTVDVATDACVWQSTGEDWRDVRIACSTERPSLGASPPELVDDVLRVQRKSDVIVAETRDQDLDVAGLGLDASGRAARAAAEVPGVDDGGVAQLLRAEHAATVIADGRPHRIALGGFRAAAELALVALPERASSVFVRARLPNRGGRPLLAGPVDLIMDSGHVGRTQVLYVAPDERFTIGFGPDAELRVHRSEERERDEAGVLGGKNVTTVRLAVRVSNLGDQPRTLDVTERIPVSELEQVEIALLPPDERKDGERKDGKDVDRKDDTPVVTRGKPDADGMITWKVEVPAYGRRLCLLAYEIRSARKVVGL